MPFILVVESNTPELVMQTRANGQLSEAENYAAVLRRIDHTISIEFFSPYQGETLPALEGCIGAVFTGSGVAWCVDDPRADVLADAMKHIFAEGIPAYGSCNGLQLAAHVLGGRCGAAPTGREDALAREITLTKAGESHPMMKGRALQFAAPCVHRDEVRALPEGALLLAGNQHSQVQAMAYEEGNVCFWGSQYHPELSAAYVGEILSTIEADPALVQALKAADYDQKVAKSLGAMNFDLSFETRTLELQNWLAMVQGRAVSSHRSFNFKLFAKPIE
jgi:GMP synthase (glutamine-hydrolysing)